MSILCTFFLRVNNKEHNQHTVENRFNLNPLVYILIFFFDHGWKGLFVRKEYFCGQSNVLHEQLRDGH